MLMKTLLVLVLALPMMAAPIDGGDCGTGGTMAEFLALTTSCQAGFGSFSNFSYTGPLAASNVSVQILVGEPNLRYPARQAIAMLIDGPFDLTPGQILSVDMDIDIGSTPHNTATSLEVIGTGHGTLFFLGQTESFPSARGGMYIEQQNLLMIIDATTNVSVPRVRYDFEAGLVPEPATYGIVGIGLVAIWLRTRRKKIPNS